MAPQFLQQLLLRDEAIAFALTQAAHFGFSGAETGAAFVFPGVGDGFFFRQRCRQIGQGVFRGGKICRSRPRVRQGVDQRGQLLDTGVRPRRRGRLRPLGG